MNVFVIVLLWKEIEFKALIWGKLLFYFNCFIVLGIFCEIFFWVRRVGGGDLGYEVGFFLVRKRFFFYFREGGLVSLRSGRELVGRCVILVYFFLWCFWEDLF